MKKSIILLFICIILSGCGHKELTSGKITCQQSKKILKQENTILVDVRENNEYVESHLDNAINIPYQEIVTKIKELDNINKDSKIIVYCRSGKRSNIAYNSLKNAGYKYVFDLGAISSCLS